jgi:hypothetical protein
MWEWRGIYRVLVGKPEGKRPRRRWENNIRMDFRKWDVGAWTDSSWLRIRDRWQALGNALMNIRVA